MKKLALILALLLIFSCFAACSKTEPFGESTIPDTQVSLQEGSTADETVNTTQEDTSAAVEIIPTTEKNTVPTQKTSTDTPEDSLIFAWISYFEMTVNSGRSTADTYKKYIASLFDEMKSAGVTDALVHVRAYCDAFYYSELFPASIYAKVGGKMPFDPLAIVIDVAEDYGIRVHAWINPYRVGKLDSRPESDRARLWYNEGGNEVFLIDGAAYLNPASVEAQSYIIDGVRELMDNYDLAGIHLDDYFYPSNCGDFDSTDYFAYTQAGGKKKLADFRRENVNALLSGIYSLVKSYGRDKLLTVSPSGDMEKAYKDDYADIYSWLSTEGYADYVMPQIYYGFEHSKFPFEECLSDWMSYDKANRIIPGLAAYKQGESDKYAGKGADEWVQNGDIISRQGKMAIDKGCRGYALYSASYINFS